MLNNNVINFLSQINSDPEMFSLLAKLKDEYKKGDLSEEESYNFLKNKLIPFARERGYEFSINDLVKENKKIDLLSEDSLAEVSGGVGSLNKKLLSLGLCGLSVFSSASGAMPQIANSVFAVPSDEQNTDIENLSVEEIIDLAKTEMQSDEWEGFKDLDEYRELYDHIESCRGVINDYIAITNSMFIDMPPFNDVNITEAKTVKDVESNFIKYIDAAMQEANEVKQNVINDIDAAIQITNKEGKNLSDEEDKAKLIASTYNKEIAALKQGLNYLSQEQRNYAKSLCKKYNTLKAKIKNLSKQSKSEEAEINDPDINLLNDENPLDNLISSINSELLGSSRLTSIIEEVEQSVESNVDLIIYADVVKRGN